jgi:hypothetical protein
MAARGRAFAIGAGGAASVFILLNIAAAHLRSDCGIRAVIGLWLPGWSFCADDIKRVGFPFLVLEQGGFAYRSSFDPQALFLDVIVAVGVSLAVGLICRFVFARRAQP